MARDKRTARAEARRRHRDQLRAEEDAARAQAAGDAEGTGQAGSGPQRPADAGAAAPRSPIAAFSSLLRVPDIREDLRALPWIARHSWALVVPLAGVAVTFVLALDPRVYKLESSPGDPLTLVVSRSLFQFVLLPPPVTPVFIAGVLAPKASWLAGGIAGLLSTLAFVGLVTIHDPAKMSVGLAVDLIVLYLPLYLLLGGFAGWYRRWLVGRQQRSRQATEDRRKTRVRDARRAKAAPVRR